MAFGFGVGDIIALTTMIIKTVEDIHDAPEELQDLAERVEVVEMILESTHEKLPQNAPASNMSNIVRLKNRVKDVLSTMKNIVVNYRDSEGRVNPFHRAKYIWDKRGIADLLVKLEGRTRNLTDFLIMQTWDSTNQIPRLIEQVLAQTRQDQNFAKDQHRTKEKTAVYSVGSQKKTDIQTTGSDQADQVQAVLDHILQTQRRSDSTLLADQEDVSIEKEIEIQLKQAGIGPTFTSSLIEVINKQRKQFSHAEDIDPMSYTGGRNRLEDPKGWIMVVDSYNEEFLVKGGKAPESAALKAISGKKSYFRSDEKNDILARVAQHRSRGIDNWHFRKYEYMLCFDRSVCETITTLANYCKKRYGNLPSYAKMPKIVLIKDIRLKDAAADLDADATTKLVTSIKDGIRSFLEAEYHWKKPPLSVTDGPFRTKQVVLPNMDVKLDTAAEEAKLNEISAKTDCRIRVTDERFDSQLLSITGRSEALPFASSLLREALL